MSAKPTKSNERGRLRKRNVSMPIVLRSSEQSRYYIYICLYFTKSMVVIVRIEQTNKQTTRQINKQKLNHGTYWQNSPNLHSNVLARFSHRSLGMSKAKQCWQYLTISILLVLNSLIKTGLITKSIHWKSDFVSGQASKPHKITGIHLLMISCIVLFDRLVR